MDLWIAGLLGLNLRKTRDLGFLEKFQNRYFGFLPYGDFCITP
jgi:hypothetical protein